MAHTAESLVELLGDEAQVVPGAIMVVRDKHIIVAELTVGGGFVITSEGQDVIDSIGKTSRRRKMVESANTSASDELNLSE